MKAIEIAKHGDPSVLRIVEKEIPDPGPDEILIRVRAFGLNFADLLARMGLYPDAPALPFVPGYEVAGTVEKLGAQVKDFKKGDRVFALTNFGGYAEYAVAYALATRPIPKALKDEEAAALPVNGITAYVALVERGNLHPHERVLIQAAAGGVGLCAVQIAKAIGATIFGTAGSEKKCGFLKKFGVDHPINYQSEDFQKKVFKITQGEGVDLVLDSLGGESLRKGYKILRPHGRLVALGVASMVRGEKRNLPHVILEFLKTPRLKPLQMMSDDKSFIGINLKRMADHRPDLLAQCFKEFAQWVEEGKIKPVLSQVFPFDQIREAHRFLQERKGIGKVVVIARGLR